MKKTWIVCKLVFLKSQIKIFIFNHIDCVMIVTNCHDILTSFIYDIFKTSCLVYSEGALKQFFLNFESLGLTVHNVMGDLGNRIKPI